MLPEPVIKHMSEFLAIIKALTKDKGYDGLISQIRDIYEGGEKAMKLPSLFEVARNEGRAEGITIGEERTKRSIMEKLIKIGMSQVEAANIAGLPLKDV